MVSRPRSVRVEDLKALLVRRLSSGHLRAGDRFLSNRALASRYAVSYQTAHRLIGELCAEGLLERRAASGTFVPGKSVPLLGAYLCFHSRARRDGSFGARLLHDLTERLSREGIQYRVTFDDAPDFVGCPDEAQTAWYPVLWEWGTAMNASAGLLLHRRPASGIDSTRWDSVTVDDFSGGVCAAQVLSSRVPDGTRWVVVSGPETDDRSRARVAGFRSILNCDVIPAGWFSEDGERVAQSVFETNPSGVFCANDRLAEGLLRSGAKKAPIVGFDDAPIAEALGLTTIAIPWAELTQAAVTTIRNRLVDQRSSGTHQVVAPRPVIRW